MAATKNENTWVSSLHIANQLKGHEGSVRSVRFNQDGNYCMTCGTDKTMKLWNPYSGVLLKSYLGHGYEVLDAVASQDNSTICTCGGDRTVVVWDVATGKIVRKYRGHLSKVNCVKANQPDFSVVASGSYDATIRCWDCRSRSTEPVQILDEAKDSIPSLQVSDHQILSGSVDGHTRIYDLRAGKMVEDCIGEPVTSVSYTHDGQCILVSSLDDTVRLMDKDTGEMLNNFKGHKNTDYKIDSCLSFTDTHVISGSDDGNIYIWDLIEAKIVRKIDKVHKSCVYSLSAHPSKNCILSASTDAVFLWSTEQDEKEKNS